MISIKQKNLQFSVTNTRCSVLHNYYAIAVIKCCCMLQTDDTLSNDQLESDSTAKLDYVVVCI
jgi:hypothetical protein